MLTALACRRLLKLNCSYFVEDSIVSPCIGVQTVHSMQSTSSTWGSSVLCWAQLVVIWNFPLTLVALPTTFLQPPSMEPPVPPRLDNVVSATNLSCTVTNEGSFHWRWISPPGITLSQMWVTDGTRTSIVQISQISAANAGDYTCMPCQFQWAVCQHFHCS